MYFLGMERKSFQISKDVISNVYVYVVRLCFSLHEKHKVYLYKPLLLCDNNIIIISEFISIFSQNLITDYVYIEARRQSRLVANIDTGQFREWIPPQLTSKLKRKALIIEVCASVHRKYSQIWTRIHINYQHTLLILIVYDDRNLCLCNISGIIQLLLFDDWNV